MKRENRILKHSEFDEIIRRSPAIRTNHYVIHHRDNNFKKTRIGIAVSKKNGNAVTRNRIKRQIRAMLAGNWDFATARDIIIIVRTTYQTSQFNSEQEELLASLGKIGEAH